MLRQRLHRQLSPQAWREAGLSPVNKVVCALILLASLVAILETEPTIRRLAPGFFRGIEIVFVTLFAVEYLARVYAVSENPRYRGIGGASAISPPSGH